MHKVDSEPIYRDGRFYDLENSQLAADIPFYLNLAKEAKGPVLEVACGTGRITIPVSQAGIDVTGLDVSPGMLSQARAKSSSKKLSVEWIEADCRNFQLDKKFSLIFMAFNSIQHLLDHDSLERFFAKVHEHLLPGGTFAFDVFNPSLQILTRPENKRFPVFRHPNPDNNQEEIMVEETNLYDSKTQINHIKWYFSFGERRDAQVHELNMRQFFPQELDALLKYNGFKIIEKFGNFTKKSFASEDMKQIYVCRNSLRGTEAG